MLGNLFLFVIAILVLIIAELLVRWQNEQDAIAKKLRDDIENGLGEAVNNYISITGEEPHERTIEGLEKDVQKLNNSLRRLRTKSHSYKEVKSRYVKRQKNFTDD